MQLQYTSGLFRRAFTCTVLNKTIWITTSLPLFSILCLNSKIMDKCACCDNLYGLIHFTPQIKTLAWKSTYLFNWKGIFNIKSLTRARNRACLNSSQEVWGSRPSVIRNGLRRNSLSPRIIFLPANTVRSLHTEHCFKHSTFMCASRPPHCDASGDYVMKNYI